MSSSMLAELAGILTFDAGYNTAVVMVGSTIFGTRSPRRR